MEEPSGPVVPVFEVASLRNRDPHASLGVKHEDVRRRGIAWTLFHVIGAVFNILLNEQAWADVRRSNGSDAETMNEFKGELARGLLLAHLVAAAANALSAYFVSRHHDLVHSSYGCQTVLNIVGIM